ncbi:hypothetical protein ACFT30_11805 [Microbacterium ureisolvens]|uniref:hypothetical protein n=1 Tax=Microbacterium ureisolvens TaxID=2781186 RepID=UPI00363BAAF1
MAFRDLMRIILRRWYVVSAVLIIAAGATLVLAQDRGVFTTRTAITFMYPDASALDRYNGIGDRSVISFVSAIAQEINDGAPPKTYAADSAPYWGAGVRDGVLVTLPNEGTQWLAIYRRAQIDIQIVDPSYAHVEATQEKLIDEVFRVADQRQADAGIPKQARIVPIVEPLTTYILQASSNRTAIVLACGGMAVAALLVGGWAAVMLDRLLRHRTRVRRASETVASEATMKEATV